MDDAELESLLGDTESDRAERTISSTNTDKFGEAICAFANDLPNHRQPGYLFVGARPDGAPEPSVKITDQLLQNLAAIRSDGNLLPQPTMIVQKRLLRGGEMAVIEVQPSELPPVRYKGTVWVRVGPRRARATEADERALVERRAAVARTWDARPCGEAGLSDLALALFDAYRNQAVEQAVLAENHRSVEEQLASLRFFEARSRKPTNASIVLFGKDTVFFFAGAYVQFVEYAGHDQAAPVRRQQRISGDMLTILRELDSLVKTLENARPVETTALQEKTVFDYPPAALRETFVNAVVHRDYESSMPVTINAYDDRLEILNPGGLFDLSAADLGAGFTGYRNPVLAEAARVYGFVNRFGRGLPRTKEAMAANGSGDLELTPTERHFSVMLPRRL